MDYLKAIELYMERPVNIDEFTLIDRQDGEGAQFEEWNIIDKPQPTIAELEAIQPQVEAQENNSRIKAQIQDIEINKQPRAIREVALDIDGAIERLFSINSEISELRGQLK